MGRAVNGSRFRLRGDVTFSVPVGALCGVTPVATPGSPAHVIASFLGGASIELDVPTVVELARRFPESLASLHRINADCSGSVADLGDAS